MRNLHLREAARSSRRSSRCSIFSSRSRIAWRVPMRSSFGMFIVFSSGFFVSTGAPTETAPRRGSVGGAAGSDRDRHQPRTDSARDTLAATWVIGGRLLSSAGGFDVPLGCLGGDSLGGLGVDSTGGGAVGVGFPSGTEGGRMARSGDRSTGGVTVGGATGAGAPRSGGLSPGGGGGG
jgi:hypothetical protein